MENEVQPTSNGLRGILTGVVAMLVIGPLVSVVVDAWGNNPVQNALSRHQSVVTATDAFHENANSEELMQTLVANGVGASLAHAPDLSEAHLKLEGGMQVGGNDRSGAAFRYRDGDKVYVLQSYFDLPGSGTTSHSRHIGHNLMRGYKHDGGAAAVWSDYGSTFVFSGDGDEEHILDVAALAFFGMTGGGGGHH